MISTIYELPFKGNRLVEGWQLSTIVQEQSGNPLNILSGSTSAVNINNLTGVATIRLDLIAPIKAEQGRTLASGDDEPSRDGVVVLSRGFWRERLGGDPNVLSRTISLGGRVYQVCVFIGLDLASTKDIAAR